MDAHCFLRSTKLNPEMAAAACPWRDRATEIGKNGILPADVKELVHSSEAGTNHRPDANASRLRSAAADLNAKGEAVLARIGALPTPFGHLHL